MEQLILDYFIREIKIVRLLATVMLTMLDFDMRISTIGYMFCLGSAAVS